MGNRVDKDREQKLQPQRINTAVEKITALGYEITKRTSTSVQFQYKGNPITLFPYSGWASGKGIIDGRGLEKLLKQIKPLPDYKKGIDNTTGLETVKS